MDELKPEERARIKIDEQLVDAGWHIANRGGVTYAFMQQRGEAYVSDFRH